MNISPTSQTRVATGTIVGTLICILVAVVVDSFSFEGMTEAQIRTSFRNDILIPLALGGGFFYLLLSKMRALAIAHRELQRIASTDSLTAVLNRGAFSMLVEAYFQDVKRNTLPREGALLLVDADYFKKINDSYGHQAGDAVLKRIAGSIRTSVRDNDLVVRVGGEEFGVFLPGVSLEIAAGIAERIRSGVHKLPVEEGGEHLSVSVGGALFTSITTYDHLYAQADQNLYAAKAAGRNQVVVATLPEAS
ncbi:GGDEF domain-containing protein (plasmid) [Rhizobium sp. CB3171]|uniref:GGDEF domain-containing protein n=1 Tax=Rhizobium sp. CB3171 TaxID=3039157 RepID=UPI0024B2733E|nr:GGDEF domain-containing protein [Rhizobium sp. CB3171]WFU05775.1 GGDEF domain-containing protein [Rhizobium sp. CB3171]